MLFSAQIHDIKSWIPWVRIRREQSAMRAIVEQRRRMLNKDEVEKESALIISQIEQMSAFRDAQTVLMYYPVHNEVDLRPLLQRYKGQKTFILPVTHRKSIEPRQYLGEETMQRGQYSVPEPQTTTYEGKIDLILVPGVIFDLKCNRIGRGAGFYDRFLKKHKDVPQLGVAYDFQIKNHDIPHSHFDKPVDGVITPSRSIGL